MCSSKKDTSKRISSSSRITFDRMMSSFFRSLNRDNNGFFLNNANQFFVDTEVELAKKIHGLEIIDFSLTCNNELFMRDFEESALWSLLASISKGILRRKLKAVMKVLGPEKCQDQVMFSKFNSTLLKQIKAWAEEYPTIGEEDFAKPSPFAIHQKHIDKYIERKTKGEVPEEEEEVDENVQFVDINTNIGTMIPADIYFSMALGVKF